MHVITMSFTFEVPRHLVCSVSPPQSTCKAVVTNAVGLRQAIIRMFTWETASTTTQRIEVSIETTLHILCLYVTDIIACDLDSFLRALFLANPYEDLTFLSRGNRLEGTCEWLLETEEYRTWIDGPGIPFLWLFGVPGIGKSTISNFVVEHLQAKEELHVAYFFCSAQDHRRDSACAILASILGQLLSSKKLPTQQLYKDCVQDVYRFKREYFFRHLVDLWRALSRTLKELRSRDIYILIDALDECKGSSRSQLLHLFRNLESEISVKFLITMRSEMDIDFSVESFGNAQVSSHILKVDSSKINDDLTNFIDHRLKDLPKHWKTSLIDEIRAKLKEKAGGTFLWASLILQDIKQATTMEVARKKLQSLPSDLSLVYRRILQDIIKDNTDQAAFTLQWVVASRRPIKPQELATARAMQLKHGETLTELNVDEHTDVYRSCGALLHHDPETDTIKLIHQSANDYLLDLENKHHVPPEYRVQKDKARMTIIETCWRYLSMKEFQTHNLLFASLHDFEVLTRTKLPQRVYEKYSFLRYAAGELHAILEDPPSGFVSFIEKQRHIDSIPGTREHWFVQFSSYGYKDGVQALLYGSPELSVTTIRAALKHAIAGGYGEISRILVAAGAQVASNDLFYAAYRNDEESVSLCLKLGACDDIPVRKALEVAASLGSTQILNYLARQRLDLDEELKTIGSKVLYFAVQGGHVAAMQFLIQQTQGAILNWKLPGLYLNIAVGNFEMLKLLYERIHPLSETKLEELMEQAIRAGTKQCVQYLAGKGAAVRVGAVYSSGRTALHLAASESHDEMIHLLIDEYEANPNAQDDSGWAPLHYACLKHGAKAASVLLNLGALIDPVTKTGKTPLHLAAMVGDSDLVGLLLDFGANLETRDCNGMTPLHLVAAFGTKRNPTPVTRDFESLELLVDKLKRANSRRANLRKAELRPSLGPEDDDEDVMRLLLEREANPCSEDISGRSVLWAAASAQNRDCCVILLDWGADPALTLLSEHYPNLPKLTQLWERWNERKERPTMRQRQSKTGWDDFVSDHGANEDDMRRDAPKESVSGETMTSTQLSTEIVDLFCEAVSYTESLTSQTSSETLFQAASMGCEASVALQLDRGADMDDCELSPLAEAATQGHEGVVRLLIDRKAKVNQISIGPHGQTTTALAQAILNGHGTVVRALLDAGADLETGYLGSSAWELLCMAGREFTDNDVNSYILSKILELRDPRNVDKAQVWSILTQRMGPGTVIEFLKMHPTFFEIKGAHGQRFLNWAIELGHQELVDQLSDMDVKQDIPLCEILELADYPISLWFGGVREQSFHPRKDDPLPFGPRL